MVIVAEIGADAGFGVFAFQKLVRFRDESRVGTILDAIVSPVSGSGFNLGPSHRTLAEGADGTLVWGKGVVRVETCLT